MPRKGSTGIGAAVARLRQARGWSQETLAKLVGIRQGHISEIERGNREPSLLVTRELARVFGVTVDELLQGPAVDPSGDPPS